MKLSVREMVIISMFAALACAGGLLLRFAGKGVVPYSILPFVVLLSGMVLGGRLGAMSMLVYVALGLAGVPVFSSMPYGGLAYLVKPTAGFLFGFIAGALVTGAIVKRFKISGFFGYLLSSFAGVAVIYLIGLPYFYIISNFFVGNPYDMAKILNVAFKPFIALDLLKGAIAAGIAVPLSKQLRQGNLGYR